MAKILGIDIGYDSVKLALVSGKQVKKTAIASMPKRLMREGRLASPEAMGELLAQTMKKNGIHCSSAAVAFSNEAVFVRNVTMPVMAVEQLSLNLPYEFRDYITDELKNYIFDYAMLSDAAAAVAANTAKAEKKAEKPKKEKKTALEAFEAESEKQTSVPEAVVEAGGSGSGSANMELLAVAAPVSLMEETRRMLRKAGMKLTKAAPAVCSYTGLIRSMDPARKPASGEYCFLDLGYQSIRMYMFQGEKHIVTRVLESGLAAVDAAIADAYNVDEHLAHTYVVNNYEDCQSKDVCVNAFNNIAIELMRALNFYRFSNPESTLSDIWLCGGGAYISSLVAAIESGLEGMKIHSSEELLPGGRLLSDSNALAQAIGITQE
jgi:type IV pilus assembly protein PilM